MNTDYIINSLINHMTKRHKCAEAGTDQRHCKFSLQLQNQENESYSFSSLVELHLSLLEIIQIKFEIRQKFSFYNLKQTIDMAIVS